MFFIFVQDLGQQLGSAISEMAQAIDKKLRIILENYHLYDKHINPILGMLNELVARCEILTAQGTGDDEANVGLDNSTG